MSGRRPPGDISAGGATILGSRSSAGRSTAYEVMAEYRNQVISPVTAEEVHFSTPMGTRGSAAPDREFGSSPFGGTPMQDVPSGPSRPDGGSDLQLALLSLGRQLSGPPRPRLESLPPPGAPQATSGGARSGIGERRVPQGPEGPNIGAGPKCKKGSGDLKLYRYDLQDRHRICGRIISRRGGRGESLLRCHQLWFCTRQDGFRSTGGQSILHR